MRGRRAQEGVNISGLARPMAKDSLTSSSLVDVAGGAEGGNR